MRHLRRTVAAVLSTAALLAPLATTTPVAAATPPPPVSRDGAFTVLDGKEGSTVLWAGTTTGDGRPELLLGGAPLGTPLGGVNGAPYRLVVPGVHGIRADALSVSVGGRPLERQTARRGTATSVGVTPTHPTALVSPDPGKAGTYRTTSSAYRLPDLRIDGLPVPVEVQGEVVAPVGAPGKRGVVLFLHGRHATCFAGEEVTIDWPCAKGYAPIPSLSGYRQAQELLASRGYVTVSIAANGINGQDGALRDAGAHARSVLIRHHLTLLTRFADTTGLGTTARLRGHVDLTRVMLVGHSRGGEGAARAAIETTPNAPFQIVGQLLLAPTDFGRQVAVGTPTTVLLPYCDGDVSDLQGQQFVDQARGLATGDRALVTSAMVFGANHNYFNAEWTPGVAAAPAGDDWWDDSDPACGTSAKGRLTPAEQRRVGATYVAAAAESYLGRSTTAVALLDGRKVRAASAGRAVVQAQALGSDRQALVLGAARQPLSTTSGMSASTCRGFSDDGVGECRAQGGDPSPHWLPGDLPAPYALRLSWKTAGSTATLALPGPVDVSRQAVVEARVISDVRAATLAVVLTDRAGRTAVVPAGTVSPLPGPDGTRKLWATTVRVPLASFTGVDLRSIRSVGFRGTSSTGHVFVLDAFAASPGQARSTLTPRSVPRFDVLSPTVDLPPDDQVHQVPVTVRVVGRVERPAWLWVATQSSGENPTGRAVQVRPGTRSLVVTVPVLSSSLWSPYPDQVQVAAYALRDAVVGSYVGGAEVTSAVRPPTLRVVAPDVTVAPGKAVHWSLELSAPTRYGFYADAAPVAPAGGRELTTADVTGAWVDDHAVSPTLPDGGPAPLSQAGVYDYAAFDALATTATIDLPTRTTARPGRVEWVVAPDGQVLTEPLRLTAVVR